MNLSYSNHIGGVQTTSALSGVGKHNERKYDRIDELKYRAEHNFKEPTENVRLRGSGDIYKDVEEIYKENFQPAIDRYNSQQDREDRQKGDYKEYMREISESKQNVAIEMIIQVGSKGDFEGADLKDIKPQFNEIYESQVRYLEENLPNFKIASANIHYDESSPHIHIVGVPVGTGYSRGLDTRVSQRQVFNKDTLRDVLQRDMRAEMERELQKRYRDIALKEKEQGRQFSKSVGAYKEHMEKTKEVERKLENLEREYNRQLESRENRGVDKETLMRKEDLTFFGNIKKNSESFKEMVRNYEESKGDKERLTELSREYGSLESKNIRLEDKYQELLRINREQEKELERYRQQEREKERERQREIERPKEREIDRER